MCLLLRLMAAATPGCTPIAHQLSSILHLLLIPELLPACVHGCRSPWPRPLLSTLVCLIAPPVNRFQCNIANRFDQRDR